MSHIKSTDYKDHSKEIFKMLGLKPMEKFKIKALKEVQQNEYDGYLFYFTSNLICYYNGMGIKNGSDYTVLPDILSGQLKIVKELTTKNIDLTKEEQTVIDFLKLCGYKYIAQDNNGENWAYKSKPIKGDSSWLNNNGGKALYVDYPLLFVSWEDEEPCIIE